MVVNIASIDTGQTLGNSWVVRPKISMKGTRYRAAEQEQ
jgi:hypothetical protein